MPIKYIPYVPNTIEGQAVLNNIVRTRRLLRYRDNDEVYERIKRGLPLYEVNKEESVGDNPKNMLIRGDCLSACAYLKEKGIELDLVYIDPPFASGADYAKKIFIRKNPKVAELLNKASEELEIDELKVLEEKMYGDIWSKEDYLNWLFENLTAIKSVMSENAAIFVHLDWNIGHYAKIIMDEIFGEENFRNEIFWYYYNKLHGSKKKVFPRATDSIFYYLKNKDSDFTFKHIKEERDKPVKKNKYSFVGGKIVNDKGEDGKAIMYTSTDRQIDNVWRIRMLQPANKKEWIDYPTQKPENLIERILEAASEEGMLVADFFGGSGVTATVSHKMNRNFIHVDVGINSIQTTRDRLVAENAEFDVLEIKDGVSLYRNPTQTMEKLKMLIPGLTKESSLSDFWAGAIHDSKLGMIPVYLPNLMDHSSKVLDIPLINRLVNGVMPELPDTTIKAVVYYVDIEDEKELKQFINEYNSTNIKLELRDLKEVLDEIVVNDTIEYGLDKTVDGYEISFNRFISDRILKKIDEYNNKRLLSEKNKELFVVDQDDDEQETVKSKIKVEHIEISEEGLELIEYVSVDCTNLKGVWNSDTEIKIDKNSFLIINGVKTEEFWDGKVFCKEKPLRVKVRNIAGDETILPLN